MLMRLILCCFAAVLPVAAWSAAPAALYKEHCAVCHGDRGDGQTRARSGLNPPPRDFTSEAAAIELSRERMITSVTHGRPGTAMVAFEGRLSEREIESIVDYIRTEFMPKPKAKRAAGESLGKAIYTQHCAVCHGDKGSGAMWTQASLNPAPRNFTAVDPNVFTRERMIASVTLGRPGTAMMSFRKRLSPKEIEAVVDYIRTTFITRAASAAGAPSSSPHAPHGGHGAMPGMASAAPQAPVKPADMSLPLPNGLKGDFAKGRTFYLSNCADCHGAEGNGRGPRSHFIEPRPRNFLGDEARARLNRPALFEAISKGVAGTPMPAWNKVLDAQTIADVAEYVFSAYVRPDKKKLDPF